MRTKLMFVLSLAGAILAFAGQARANTLDGVSVTVNYLYPDLSTVYQTLGTGTVTGAGFTVNSFGQHDYTVFPSEIDLSNVLGLTAHFLPASFNGYQLINDTGSPAITGVTIATNNIAGFSASDISFDATNVWLNLQGLSTNPGPDLQLGLQFGTTVPDPPTLALFGVGLLGLGFSRRRKRA